MKLLMVTLALVLPAMALGAVKDVKEYRTYDCQITGNGGGAHYVTGYFMSISIDDHIGQFFQERFELDGSQIQLQVLIEETKKTPVDGSVIVLQNLKVDDEETSVEKTVKSVEKASTTNGDFASICKIMK
ncbi:hypothetical protein B9G69_004600 [Bdellovibrio sp. SKB1291214]|uniref:hypothetical protein n=1 Tax=Bdellovibrio sp. SKB1291214 TaxID=1732569 RepID=UPI000B515499|nr:hypothetical protein [Bdellovibrio sp. SKB1291214]UYL09854.1 hypothetical protein B9G69_004600 [Bdellovibrio sp. SKB1291214]